MTQARILSNFCAGSFEPASGTRLLESVDPARPDVVVAQVCVSDAEAIDRAVAAASNATKGWCAVSASAKGEALYAWSDRLAARAAEIAEAVAVEVGKPIAEAKGEVGRAVALLRYYAGEAVRPIGEVVPALSSSSLQYAVRKPLGVVALVTPWNFPIAIPVWKAAPALAMGNTVVLKPSELSGWCAQLLAETARGLPDGVFNVVQGDGGTGSGLVNHPDIHAVSFTGSVSVGRSIQETCAGRNVKCQCEMGGKNAAVVLDDADLARAAGLVAGGAMRFAGQKCTATSRVIVTEAVAQPFMEHLSTAVDSLPSGSPLEPSTAIGPVIDERSFDRLKRTLSDHKEETLYAQAGDGPGYWVRPTVIGPVDPDSEIAQDELFGPVLALIRVKDFDQAIEAANATRYGLSTAVYTRDVASALAYVDRVEAGLVRVNGDTTGVDLHAPFGGVKASSSGSREQGTVAKDFYTDWKTVQINP